MEKQQDKTQATTIPTKMKAMIIEEYGDIQKLKQVDDIFVPQPDDDDYILVQVYYTGISANDYKIRSGNLANFFFPSFPLILGQDASGRVVSCGKRVTRFKPGDDVLGMKELVRQVASRDGEKVVGGGGTYAEYVLFKESELAHKPMQLSFEHAAALPSAALASYQSLHQVKPGQKVLVLGSSGGVGSYAVQYAKVLGAHVIAVCSSMNADYVKHELGADQVVIRDSKHEFVNQLPNVDVVFDLVGDSKLQRRLFPLLSERKGKYVLAAIGEEKMSPFYIYFMLGMYLTWRRVLSWFGRPTFEILATKPDGKALEQVVDLHVKHQFRMFITRCYPGLEFIPTTHKLMEKKIIRGKLVVQVAALPHSPATLVKKQLEQV